MALDNVEFDIDGITADAARAIEGAATSDALRHVDTVFLGKDKTVVRLTSARAVERFLAAA